MSRPAATDDRPSSRLPWTTAVPPLGLVVLAAVWGRDLPALLVGAVALVLAGAVLAAVHHAEVVAHRVGEPFGSLVLAVAVTVIEVALIVTLMVVGRRRDGVAGPRHGLRRGDDHLQRDPRAVAARRRAARRHLAVFNAEGTGAALATVATLATLSLVLPTFTTSRPGPEFSPGQLAFAALASLALYAMFVVTQTVRHRDFFLPVGRRPRSPRTSTRPRPPTAPRPRSLVLLVVALVAVVGLAKVESPAIEAGGRGGRLPAVVRRRRHRPAGAAARDPRGGPGRPPRTGADQPQPGARLGDRQHRPDHPGHRGRVDLARRPAGAGPRRRCSWCCWP